MVLGAARDDDISEMKPTGEIRERLASVSDPLAVLEGIFARAPIRSGGAV